MSQTIIENSTPKSKMVSIASTRVSKKDQARELYVKNPDLSRDQMIQKLIDELEMPENSARTYVSICARELNGTLGKEFKTRNVNRSKSKRELSYAIYVANSGLDRKEIIAKMVAELDMTHNSAATHCSIAANRAKNGGI